ncbi:TorF family putative porin [Halorhodospira abdelmalekii]|uniref:TorF family putative porin n=1 Tax=Halorhodospira abdelmalekii TaxID=421629 RepID=UPI001F5BF8BA|nr:TorF family putative porin [Halorhodospira abdelmalekii]
MRNLSNKQNKVYALLISALTAGCLGAGPAQAELTFNVGLFTDYIDHGESVSNNNAVVQGGAEYSHASGGFLGTQLSTLGGDEAGQEAIPFAGWGFPVGPLDLAVGYAYFHYSEQRDADLGEVFFTLDWDRVSAEITYAVHADDRDARGDTVYWVEVGQPVMPETRLFGGVGYDDPDAESGVAFWMLGLARQHGQSEISLTYASRDESGAQSLFVAGYTVAF